MVGRNIWNGIIRYSRSSNGYHVVCIIWYMVHHSMVSHGMHDMAWCGMLRYVWAKCSILWYGMVWYGMVWYGMVWYGMVWYGMVWYGMV